MIIDKLMLAAKDFVGGDDGRAELTFVRVSKTDVQATDSKIAVKVYPPSEIEDSDFPFRDVIETESYDDKNVALIPKSTFNTLEKMLKINAKTGLPICSTALYVGVKDDKAAFMATDLESLATVKARIGDGEIPDMSSYIRNNEAKFTIAVNAAYLTKALKMLQLENGKDTNVFLDFMGETQPIKITNTKMDKRVIIYLMPVSTS